MSRWQGGHCPHAGVLLAPHLTIMKGSFVGCALRTISPVAGTEARLLGGTRILLARAEQARDVLPEGLVELGMAVDVVPVYRALPPESVPPESAEAMC